MSITFQQGTKLYIDDGTNRYEIVVSSASANQTYKETSRSVKTIHTPNVVADTFTTEKGTANLTFSCYIGSGEVEGSILDLFGFVLDTGKYRLSTSNNILNTADIYIDAGNTVYKLDTCVGSNISFKLSRKEILSVEVTATAVELIAGATLPSTGTLYLQNLSSFYNDTIDIAGFTGVVGVSCELTRNVRWVSKKSIHDIGSLYLPKAPILESLALSGTITKNKKDNVASYSNTGVPIVIDYGDTFSINLDACNTTDRWEMGSIHKSITDYKLLPTATDIYITI
jgi:hypothetical protein